jgi:hypothetical protein
MDRVPNKESNVEHHTFEIEPRRRTDGGGYVGALMIEAYRTKSAAKSAIQGGVNVAEMKAREILAEVPTVDSVGIYHSYPSPGPRRRFVGEITRES